jgi:NTP pyrophosphatase (non-canonical NTP hydrolase)
MSMMEYYETADQLRRAEQAKQDEANAAEFIRERVDPRERLAQLAEEAIELAHAALKLRRAMGGSNPTPVAPEDAFAQVNEEIADVTLLVRLLYLDTNPTEVEEICRRKLLRWRDRLLKASEEQNHAT